jgi:hypothetical protein
MDRWADYKHFPSPKQPQVYYLGATESEERKNEDQYNQASALKFCTSMFLL